MFENYFVRVRGHTLGPYSLDKLQQMVRKGQVGRTQEMSTDGESWAAATTFPEVFARPVVVGTLVDEPAASIAATDQIDSISQLGQPSGGPPAVVSVGPQWFYSSGGEQSGPVPTAQLISIARGGQLEQYDLVWREGMDAWESASDIPELARAWGGGHAIETEGVLGPKVGLDAFCRECGSPVNKRAIVCPKCGVPTAPDSPFPAVSPSGNSWPEMGSVFETHGRGGNPKSKSTAGLLALLVGGLGVHHFYLGNAVLGIIYLVFCWTFIPGIIAFIEGIFFLTMSDDAFNAKYNR